MGKICDIDTTKIDNVLNNLNTDNRNKCFMTAMSKAGEELVQETKSSLVSSLPNASRGKRYGSPMSSGVKLKKDKDYKEVMVHIMSDFRLKFFELGTNERYLKKPLPKKSTDSKFKSGKNNSGGTPYRGRIIGKHFFQKARNSVDLSGTIINTLIQELNKLIK